MLVIAFLVGVAAGVAIGMATMSCLVIAGEEDGKE